MTTRGQEGVDSLVGVRSRNFSNARIESLGWRAKVFLNEGIRLTYPWIEAQVRAAGQAQSGATTSAPGDRGVKR